MKLANLLNNNRFICQCVVCFLGLVDRWENKTTAVRCLLEKLICAVSQFLLLKVFCFFKRSVKHTHSLQCTYKETVVCIDIAA